MNFEMTLHVMRASKSCWRLFGYVVMFALMCGHPAYADDEIAQSSEKQNANKDVSHSDSMFMSETMIEGLSKHETIFSWYLPKITVGDLNALLGKGDLNDFNFINRSKLHETYILHDEGMFWFLIRKMGSSFYLFGDSTEFISVKAVAYSHAEEKAPSTDSGVQDINEDPLTTESTDPTDILIERMGEHGFIQVWYRHMSVRDLKVLLDKDNLRDAELIHDFTSKRTYLLMEGGMMWLLTVRPESLQPSGNRQSHVHPLDNPQQGVSTKVIVFPANQKGTGARTPHKVSDDKELQTQE